VVALKVTTPASIEIAMSKKAARFIIGSSFKSAVIEPAIQPVRTQPIHLQ
jgi:hypothetical protein